MCVALIWFSLCGFLHAACAYEWCGDKDCYDILKVKQRASLAEIKNAYTRLILQLPPGAEMTSAHDRYQVITRAYEILSDDRTRMRYDYAIKNPEGWIDADGNYNDQPGSLDFNIISAWLLLAFLFFFASAKWVTRQEFWSRPLVRAKKQKKGGKKV